MTLAYFNPKLQPAEETTLQESDSEEDETTDSAHSTGVRLRQVVVNELIAFFRELEISRDDTKGSEGDLAAEIASDCVKPLMPTILSSLVGGDREGERGGQEADDLVLAQRLVRLTEALPERVLNQVAVVIAGPLIRAYSTRSVSLVAESRAAILRALEVLGARAPMPLKVKSFFFSGRV